MNERVSLLKSVMAKEEVSAVILGPGVNMQYLTGFADDTSERPLLYVVPVDGEPWFFCPELYVEHLRSSVAQAEIVVWKDGEDMCERFSAAFKQMGSPGSVALDDTMRFEWFFRILQPLLGGNVGLAGRILSELRMRKTDYEVQLIEYASNIASRALSHCLGELRAGMSEKQFAKILEERMLELGADDKAFNSIVASASSSAMPHHRPTSSPIVREGAVVIDFGARYRYYNTDMTRTVYVGTPTKEFSAAYIAVKEAQLAGIEAVQEGVEARAVDDRVRSILAKKGYAQNFIHRTGHGIGLEVHEDPYINSSNTQKILDGMCFSIEPGVYFPGKFGVRIEDIVCVENGSPRVLTQFSKDLICV